VESAAIVQAIGALARGLGLVTVAEGVETLEQLEFFRQQHCDRVQGFLFSAPRSVADITEMLRARPDGQALARQGIIARGHQMSDRVGQIPTREFARGDA
jgi:sensor c-di-GMP phosphodiesterase-like protein